MKKIIVYHQGHMVSDNAFCFLRQYNIGKNKTFSLGVIKANFRETPTQPNFLKICIENFTIPTYKVRSENHLL